MKLLGAALFALLLTSAQADATSMVFNIYFHDTRSTDPSHPEPWPPGSYLIGQADFQGTYTITDGKLTAFSAVVGVCSLLGNCLYNGIGGATAYDKADPESTNPLEYGLIWPARASSRLAYYPIDHTWNTGSNTGETIGANFDRKGVYRVEPQPEALWIAASPVPEPAALWMVLIGLLSFANRRTAMKALLAIAILVATIGTARSQDYLESQRYENQRRQDEIRRQEDRDAQERRIQEIERRQQNIERQRIEAERWRTNPLISESYRQRCGQGRLLC